MNFLDGDLTEEQKDLRTRIANAVVAAVIEACGGQGANATMLDIPLAIDGVATALGWMAANVPEFRTTKGSRLIADDVATVIKLLIRSIDQSEASGGPSMRFAWPVNDDGRPS